MIKTAKSTISSCCDTLTMNIELLKAMNSIKSDAQLEKKVNINRRTLNERRRNPRMWRVEELGFVAKAFNVPLAWLFTEHDIRKDRPNGEQV